MEPSSPPWAGRRAARVSPGQAPPPARPQRMTAGWASCVRGKALQSSVVGTGGPHNRMLTGPSTGGCPGAFAFVRAGGAQDTGQGCANETSLICPSGSGGVSRGVTGNALVHAVTLHTVKFWQSVLALGDSPDGTRCNGIDADAASGQYHLRQALRELPDCALRGCVAAQRRDGRRSGRRPEDTQKTHHL